MHIYVPKAINVSVKIYHHPCSIQATAFNWSCPKETFSKPNSVFLMVPHKALPVHAGKPTFAFCRKKQKKSND